MQGIEGKGTTRRSGTVLTLRLAQGIQQLLILLLHGSEAHDQVIVLRGPESPPPQRTGVQDGSGRPDHV